MVEYSNSPDLQRAPDSMDSSQQVLRLEQRNDDIENIEIMLLLEGVYLHYGFDFRHYAPASLKRRIWHCVREEKLNSISALQEKLLYNPSCMERFLLILSINVTALFRDVGFYRVFREKIIPRLRTYPFIRIWHAGCSSGEEVYSLAILLQEEGLYDRSRLYATDMNEVILARARDGIYPLEKMLAYEKNYRNAGGRRNLTDYYTAQYGRAIFHGSLKKNIVWSQHNLVTDGSFNEFHVILCRNVLIYFDQSLQARVHKLLYDSLITFGMLGLGQMESIRFSPYETNYEAMDSLEKWYSKIR
ncbi:MAG: CheR family methyltransferase [Burkholderiales bacterium]